MSRKNARELALHLVFEMCFQPEEVAQTMELRLTEEEMRSIAKELPVYASTVTKKDKQYVEAVVHGVYANRNALDEIIERYAKGWKLSRISRMTIAILRLALFEIQFVEDVPTGAAINEAVELAKQYAPVETAKFVNGILGSFVRETTGEIIPDIADEDEAPVANAENADDALEAPSGEESANAPSGEEPTDAPTGEEPTDVPTSEEPTDA